MQTKPLTRFRILVPAAAMSGLALAGCVVVLSCASGGTTFEPIVFDFSQTKTPTPAVMPAPAATPVPPVPPASPVPPPPAAPEKSAPAAASVPAADLTPPPREKPEAPSAAPESPLAVVARHREALDRGDTEGALAMWASNAEISADGRTTSGREAIRAHLRDRIAAPRSAATPEFSVSGGRVAEKTGPNGLVVYEVVDGRIARAWVFR